MSLKLRFINANTLKILALVLMVFDHIGLLFFPGVLWWRMVGRISFPLFAFAISEGCRYTRNKTKHFLLIFILAVICQVVYYFFDNGSLYMCILVTFSLSILAVYALQFFKKTLFDGSTLSKQILAGLLFLAVVFGVSLFCKKFTVDYGFWGCMLPVFASLFDFHRIPAPEKVQKLDCLWLRVACFGVGLCAFFVSYLPVTLTAYAFFALPILFLYNGEKGKVSIKYFFYLFYPLHLALLEGIYLLLR